jgi:hypothetical protein
MLGLTAAKHKLDLALVVVVVIEFVTSFKRKALMHHRSIGSNFVEPAKINIKNNTFSL